MKKIYIGDGVYAQVRQAMFFSELVLTTERGDGVPYNTIVLGPSEWDNLKLYVESLKTKSEEPDDAS